jgi:quinolinate synthase
MNELQQEILALKKEKKALILAHYYQTMDIQEIADHVCDSFELARRAKEATEELLILCGVRFMAESAKILNPDKTVLLPAPDAGCPMADMIEAEDVRRLREQHPEAAVVCYVNSSASVKAESDVCCTSSSAERIVRSLPNRQIIFIPDQNLGAYIASKIPEKEFILYEGYCPTHHRVRVEDVTAAKRAHPNAMVLLHPECKPEVLAYADYIGSTAGIIQTAVNSPQEEFIIGTEMGVVDRLKALHPEKRFYPMTNRFLCPNMKKIRLADVKHSLLYNEYEIKLDEEEIAAARQSLERMVSLQG